MLVLSTSKRLSLSLCLGTPFNEELTDYCLILKFTRVFTHSYTGRVLRVINRPGEHFAIMIKINPTCK